MLIRWCHSPQFILEGVGNSIKLQIPLYCMRPDDTLLVRKVEYRSEQLFIDAQIMRVPFLSPYISPRHESHYCGQDVEFFKENYDTLNPPLR